MSISYLPIIQVNLTRYGMPVCLVLGNVGNSLIIYFFYKHRENKCSIYLSFAAIMNIIFLTFNVPLLVYSSIYGDPTVQSVILCKIRHYLPHVAGQVARYLLVFTCIDRFVLTSYQGHFRNLFRKITISKVLITLTLFWFLMSVHLPIFTTVKNGACGQFPPYYIYYLSYIILFVCTLPPLFMTIFGYLTYRNLRYIRMRVRPVGNTVANNDHNPVIQQRDHDLLSMVLAEVIVYTLTMSFYPIILTEIAITNNLNIVKSTQYLAIENFTLYLASFFGNINSAAPFYIYFIACKKYRRTVIGSFTSSAHKMIEHLQTNFTH